jgi:hypothetical protein
MTRTRSVPVPITETKTHRRARTASRKPVEFDAAAHHEEIAQVAYMNWLERVGSAEEDWLKAEIQVRARYPQDFN